MGVITIVRPSEAVSRSGSVTVVTRRAGSPS